MLHMNIPSDLVDISAILNITGYPRKYISKPRKIFTDIGKFEKRRLQDRYVQVGLRTSRVTYRDPFLGVWPFLSVRRGATRSGGRFSPPWWM